MSFDPVTCCWCYGSVDWARAFGMALLCAPPTILLALRQCSTEDAWRARLLNVGVILTGVSAALFLIQIGTLPEAPVAAMSFAGLAAAASVLGVLVYRRRLVGR